jgi:hypothetical protein
VDQYRKSGETLQPEASQARGEDASILRGESLWFKPGTIIPRRRGRGSDVPKASVYCNADTPQTIIEPGSVKSRWAVARMKRIVV